MWKDNAKSVEEAYLSVDEACKAVKANVKEEIPKPDMQPKRFTVHASADPSERERERDRDFRRRCVNPCCR